MLPCLWRKEMEPITVKVRSCLLLLLAALALQPSPAVQFYHEPLLQVVCRFRQGPLLVSDLEALGRCSAGDAPLTRCGP